MNRKININKNRVVKYFCDMVSIDSESGEEHLFAEYLVKRAKELGFKTNLDSFNNVYIFQDGIGDPLMLNTHMDTVSPGKGIKPVVKNGIVRSNGKTILGADPKITIAAIFEVLTLINENKLYTRPLEIIFSCNEESGIPTVDKIKSKVKECVVPDRGTPLGEIIIESPYAQVFEVCVKGKSSYATTDFNKGKHAILSAINTINNLPIGNFDRYSTANIGKISGGTVNTVVPDNCVFTGNCYSFRKESMDVFFTHLKKVLKKSDLKYGTKSKIKFLEYFGGFNLNRRDILVKNTYLSIKKSGLVPKYRKYKAVSNANILNSIGTKTVLISNGVRKQHTVQEHVYVKDLVKLTEILLNITLVKQVV
jgi:tripeptide aminopeptidase